MSTSPRRRGRLASRRLRSLASLLLAAAGAADAEEICRNAASLLAEDTELFPFVLIYLRSAAGFDLIATAGPPPLDPEPALWQVDRAIETGVPVGLDVKRQGVPTNQALAVPIAGREVEQSAIGVLVAGVIERFTGDTDHPTFLQLVAAQVAAGIASVAWTKQEADLRAQMARAVELEHLKSDFLRLASHELRGPLAVVRGYLDMITTGTFGELKPAIANVLPVAAGKVEEMNHLVEQMLDTARIDDKRLTLSRQEIDLRPLVRECVNQITPIDEARHRIRFELAADPVVVFADRNRIAGVVTNLVDNAIKYSPDGGDVAVTCVIDEASNRALVRVADQGLGIASEDLPRLFTRFGRIVTPENSHISGTGLGLYLAREITRMHGGDVTLSSTPSRGTAVQMALPLASAKPADAALATARTNPA